MKERSPSSVKFVNTLLLGNKLSIDIFRLYMKERSPFSVKFVNMQLLKKEALINTFR